MSGGGIFVEMVEVPKQELKKLRDRSRKYQDLSNEISKFYVDDDGNEIEDGDLCDIGECAAIHFGWL